MNPDLRTFDLHQCVFQGACINDSWSGIYIAADMASKETADEAAASREDYFHEVYSRVVPLIVVRAQIMVN